MLAAKHSQKEGDDKSEGRLGKGRKEGSKETKKEYVTGGGRSD